MSYFPKNDEFWRDQESVVVQEQPPIAIYTNTTDAVVIRQVVDDGEVLVLIRPEHVPAVVRAMLMEVGLEGLLVRGFPHGPYLADTREGEYSDYDQAADESVQPKDRTAAERQRRYRASRRNGPVTPRNAETVTRLPFHEAAE